MNELGRGRVVAHVDLDAFYAAVEMQRNPALRSQPVVVVQYNPFGDLRTLKPEDPRSFPDSNGGIIAVSWEARAFGVKRNMTGQEAKKLCADLHIIQVPVAHGKADLTIYREAGSQVAAILARLSMCERASIDEVYLDVTAEASARLAAARQAGSGPPAPASWQGMHVLGAQETQQDEAADGLDESADGGLVEGGTATRAGVARTPADAAEAWWARPAEDWQPYEALLAAGAQVVWELREAVCTELGYTCSAGVAHHKILAKLCSALHKPNQQTLVPAGSVAGLLKDLPITKLRGLGGDLGKHVQQTLGVTTCGEVWPVPVSQLSSLFGDKKGPWLARLVWGVDDNDIKQRMLPNQLSCGKTFRGVSALSELPAVRHWLGQLGQELEERYTTDRAANQRMPTSLTVAMTVQTTPDAASANLTRSCPLGQANANAMADTATSLIKKWAADKRPGWKITSLFLTMSHFVSAPTGASTITRFLGAPSSTPHSPSQQPRSAVHRHHTASQAATTWSPPAMSQATLSDRSHDQTRPPDMASRASPPEEQLPDDTSRPEPYHEAMQAEGPDPGEAPFSLDAAPGVGAMGHDRGTALAPPGQEGPSMSNEAEHQGMRQPSAAHTSMHATVDGTAELWPWAPQEGPSHATKAAESQSTHDSESGGGKGGAEQPDTNVAGEQEHLRLPEAGAAGTSSQQTSSQACMPASLSDWLATGSQVPGTSASQPPHVASGTQAEGQKEHGAAGEQQRQQGVRRLSRSPTGRLHQAQAGLHSAPAHPGSRPAAPSQAALPGDGWQQVSAQEVDEAVLAELPLHIQQEVRASLRLPPPPSTRAPPAPATSRKRHAKPATAAEQRPSKSINSYFSKLG